MRLFVCGQEFRQNLLAIPVFKMVGYGGLLFAGLHLWLVTFQPKRQIPDKKNMGEKKNKVYNHHSVQHIQIFQPFEIVQNKTFAL